jgi:hypothetical protein
MFPKDLFIRDIEASDYRENFLISAVISIFVIRIFLKIFGYPQLGTGDFHIAHMLWGGFFMVAAIIVALSFLSKSANNVAAVLGGIGFGTFIDELGKFITRENNYFFQPTIALIYIIFLLLYLISRLIPRYHQISQKEYLVNALEMIKESAINDFDIEEEKRAREYLKKCDQDNPTVQALIRLLSRIDAIPAPSPSIFTRMKVLLRKYYYKVAGSGIILKTIIVFLTAQTLWTLGEFAWLFIEKPVLPLPEWGAFFSSILAGIFVVIGFFAFRFSRYVGYRFFRIAMLITILLTEFFVLMRTQWYDLIGLAANIFILLVINYAMAIERHKKKPER